MTRKTPALLTALQIRELTLLAKCQYALTLPLAHGPQAFWYLTGFITFEATMPGSPEPLRDLGLALWHEGHAVFPDHERARSLVELMKIRLEVIDPALASIGEVVSRSFEPCPACRHLAHVGYCQATPRCGCEMQ